MLWFLDFWFSFPLSERWPDDLDLTHATFHSIKFSFTDASIFLTVLNSCLFKLALCQKGLRTHTRLLLSQLPFCRYSWVSWEFRYFLLILHVRIFTSELLGVQVVLSVKTPFWWKFWFLTKWWKMGVTLPN